MKHAGLFSLDGQVALVIAGSGGIGRAIAFAFHDAGAIVVPGAGDRALSAQDEAPLVSSGQ